MPASWVIAAADGAGHRHGGFLPGHGHHPAGRRSAAHRIPLASGLSNFARIIGGGFAVSIVTTLWDRREALHQSRMADQTTIFTPALTKALAGLHSAGFPDLAAKAAVTRTMTSQAYLLAADDIFWASGWICILLIGMVWLCKRAVSGGGAPVAAD